MEESLATLRKCSHPGTDRHVVELVRHIAHVREEARKTWSPPRVRQRLVVRLRDAKAALEKTSAQQKELVEQQEALAKAIAEAAERPTKQAAAVAEHQAALETFDKAAPAPSIAEGGSPAVPGGAEASTVAAAGCVRPSWQEYQQRVSCLCRTGLPAEEAMRQASSEAANPGGLCQGPAEDLELQSQLDDSDFHVRRVRRFRWRGSDSHPGAAPGTPRQAVGPR